MFNYIKNAMNKATSKNPNLTTNTRKFIDGLAASNSAPIYTLKYEEARKVLDGLQSQIKIPKELDCDITDIEIPFSQNKNISVRVVKPLNSKEKLPVVVYFHGGGWVMGNKMTHDLLIRKIAIGANVAVFFVNYTPAPDAKYPVQLQEDYTVLEYIFKNADKYNVDGSKIAVAGDSVGGNMAAVMALQAKENNGPKIKCQILIYPVVDLSFNSQSYIDFADGPWLTKKAMEYFLNAYLDDKSKIKQIDISPLNATKEQLAGLPHTLVITDENDVLRDEGEAYATKLMDAGVKVISTRYNGTVHDFVMLAPLVDTEPTKAAISQVINTLKHSLK